MSGSLAGYNNPLEDLDQSPPPPAQDLHPAGGGFRHKLTMSSAGGACRYRECLKNHAASVGGNVTDGCGEFMPSGDDGTLEALKCAACNCHRNFHRKERGFGAGELMTVHPLQLPAPPLAPSITSPSSINHHSYHRSGPWSAPPPPTLTAPQQARTAGYGSGAATDSSSEEMNFNAYQSSAGAAAYGAAGGKKRFRTKFSQGQKEKMMEFAERLGWRIPREDDSQLQTFCAEVGVKRQVFKVWMHNNKNSAAKKNTIHIANNHTHNHNHPHQHHHDDEDNEEEEDRRSSHQTLPGIAGI